MDSKKYKNSLYCSTCRKFYTQYNPFEDCPECGYHGQELIIIEEDTCEGFSICIMDEAVLSFNNVNDVKRFIKIIKRLINNSGRKIKC